MKREFGEVCRVRVCYWGMLVWMGKGELELERCGVKVEKMVWVVYLVCREIELGFVGCWMDRIG